MGGKKKKGLAHRLAKMSDDDRARYMQHKADVEEEARRRKEQLISSFMKNKIKREDAFARLNNAKLNQDWHQTLRKRKCDELKQEIKNMKVDLDRRMDLKQQQIDNLLNELESAEEQYTNNFQAHLNHINTIIELSTKWVNELSDEYEVDKVELREMALKEQRKLAINHKEDVLYLKTLHYQQGNEGNEEFKLNYDQYLLKTEDILRENRQEFDLMRRKCERKLNAMWRQISVTLRDYFDNTDRKRMHLIELQRNDNQHAVDVAKNEEMISAKQAEIEKLQLHLENLQLSHKNEKAILENQLKAMNKEYLDAKLALKKDLQVDDRQLLALTKQSNDAIAYLRGLAVKGERIMNLTQICNKYQPNDDKKQLTTTSKRTLKSPTTPTATSLIQCTLENIERLEVMWVAYNGVVLNLNEMKCEKRELVKINNRLKGNLREMLEERAIGMLKLKQEKTNEEIIVVDVNGAHSQRKFLNNICLW